MQSRYTVLPISQCLLFQKVNTVQYPSNLDTLGTAEIILISECVLIGEVS